MKHTKENIVEVMKAVRDMYSTSAREAKEANKPSEDDKMRWAAMACDEMIWLLTDKDYFETMAKILLNE